MRQYNVGRFLWNSISSYWFVFLSGQTGFLSGQNWPLAWQMTCLWEKIICRLGIWTNDHSDSGAGHWPATFLYHFFFKAAHSPSFIYQRTWVSRSLLAFKRHAWPSCLLYLVSNLVLNAWIHVGYSIFAISLFLLCLLLWYFLFTIICKNLFYNDDFGSS